MTSYIWKPRDKRDLPQLANAALELAGPIMVTFLFFSQ